MRPEAVAPPRAAASLRRLATTAAIAGWIIAQITGVAASILLNASNGAFNRIPALVALLAGLALGHIAGRILCGRQGRSWTEPAPPGTHGAAFAAFAGLAAGEALRCALFQPWEAAIRETDYFFLALAGLGGAAWQVWFVLTFEMAPPEEG